MIQALVKFPWARHLTLICWQCGWQRLAQQQPHIGVWVHEWIGEWKTIVNQALYKCNPFTIFFFIPSDCISQLWCWTPFKRSACGRQETCHSAGLSYSHLLPFHPFFTTSGLCMVPVLRRLFVTGGCHGQQWPRRVAHWDSRLGATPDWKAAEQRGCGQGE